jgi:N-acetylneuraminate synthase
MTPSELSELKRGSEIIHSTTGSDKKAKLEENVTIAFAFASVVATKDLTPGDILSEENIWLKRPNGGDFSPTDFPNMIGKKVVAHIQANTQIKREQVDS